MIAYLLVFIVLVGNLIWLLLEYHEKRPVWAAAGAGVTFVIAATCGFFAVGALYAGIVLSAVVMGYGYLESKKLIWGRPIAAAGGTIMIILAITKMIFILTGVDAARANQRYREGVDNARLQHEKVRFYEIGSAIGRAFRGTRAVIIHAPSTDSQILELQLKQLEEGMQSLVSIRAKDTWSLPEGGYEFGDLPIESGPFTAKMFDEIVENRLYCNLIVALAGLPVDMQAMKFWKMNDETRAKLVVVDSDISAYRPLFKAGLLSMAIIQKPDVYIDIDDVDQLRRSEDYFAKNYIVVTAKNWKAIFDKYYPNSSNSSD